MSINKERLTPHIVDHPTARLPGSTLTSCATVLRTETNERTTRPTPALPPSVFRFALRV